MSDENARQMLPALQHRWELENHVTVPLPELPLPELYDNRPLHEQWLNLQGFATGDEEREAVDAGARGKYLAMRATKLIIACAILLVCRSAACG
jgi:hypothetical protein